MAKNQSKLFTALAVAAVVGGGLYWWNKNKQSEETPGSDATAKTEPEETATVTAKSKGDIYDAIEKAQEIASNTKDAIVTVKDAADNVIAEVSSGDASKSAARRERRAARKAGRKAKRSARKLKRATRRARRRRK